MSIATVTPLAAALGGGSATERFSPAYALAYRFTVEVDGMKTGWQACSGLKVDFKPAAVKAGGRYGSVSYLPGEVIYPKVVLKRALQAKDAGQLQQWLAKTARNWLDGKEVAGSQAKITLHDSYGETVMTWVLRNARPAAWSGPDLDANSSKVALETLELVHEGFVALAGSASDSQAGGGRERTLTVGLEGGSAVVEFLHPPTEIRVQVQQSAAGATTDANLHSIANVPVESGGHRVDFSRIRNNLTTYTLNNLILAGPKTMEDVQKLTDWATRVNTAPGSGNSGGARPRAGGGRGAGPNASMKPITFSWGVGFNAVPVQLKALSASYTRFTADGKPCQAKVSLTLEERETAQNANGGRNPTSGGIPGRASHIMVAAESLPALSERTYGRPECWRAIAAANGVDDPLRVPPGTTCFLPAASEVESLSKGAGGRR